MDLWYKASLVGGIHSTSLVFCENTLNQTRSTSLSSSESWLIGVQPTDNFCCHFYQPRRYFKWGFNNSCTLPPPPPLPGMALRASICSNIVYPWTWRKTYCLILSDGNCSEGLRQHLCLQYEPFQLTMFGGCGGDVLWHEYQLPHGCTDPLVDRF